MLPCTMVYRVRKVLVISLTYGLKKIQGLSLIKSILVYASWYNADQATTHSHQVSQTQFRVTAQSLLLFSVALKDEHCLIFFYLLYEVDIKLLLVKLSRILLQDEADSEDMIPIIVNNLRKSVNAGSNQHYSVRTKNCRMWC